MILNFPNAVSHIPKETVRAAMAVFGRGNFYILVGDHLEDILEGFHPSKPEEVLTPLITFFQFMEGLTDSQAMDAVRTRTDWKFALHLSLMPARLQQNALCQFRQNLLRDLASQAAFQQLIDRLLVFMPGSSKSLKSLELVSAICSLNRLQFVQQAMHQALEVLAVQFPQWLRQIVLPHWYGRYNPTLSRLDVAFRFGQGRFLMEEIASDIHHLLENVQQSGSRSMKELHQIRVLDRLWSQQLLGLTREREKKPEIFSSTDCESCFHNEAGRRLRT